MFILGVMLGLAGLLVLGVAMVMVVAQFAMGRLGLETLPVLTYFGLAEMPAEQVPGRRVLHLDQRRVARLT